MAKSSPSTKVHRPESPWSTYEHVIGRSPVQATQQTKSSAALSSPFLLSELTYSVFILSVRCQPAFLLCPIPTTLLSSLFYPIYYQHSSAANASPQAPLPPFIISHVFPQPSPYPVHFLTIPPIHHFLYFLGSTATSSSLRDSLRDPPTPTSDRVCSACWKLSRG